MSEAIEAMRELNPTVAGALFDLMGFLTSHETRWKFSAYDEASPAVEALEQWAKRRGFVLKDANVSGWKDALAFAAVQAEPAQPLAAHVPHTCAGFVGGMVGVHGRQPTQQEVWNAAIRSFIERYGDPQAAQTQAAEAVPAAESDRNDPVSALAIRLLVAAGHVTQEKANEAFHIACNCLEDEARKMNVDLPWVVRPPAKPATAERKPLTDEQIVRAAKEAGLGEFIGFDRAELGAELRKFAHGIAATQEAAQENKDAS